MQDSDAQLTNPALEKAPSAGALDIQTPYDRADISELARRALAEVADELRELGICLFNKIWKVPRARCNSAQVLQLLVHGLCHAVFQAAKMPVGRAVSIQVRHSRKDFITVRIDHNGPSWSESRRQIEQASPRTDSGLTWSFFQQSAELAGGFVCPITDEGTDLTIYFPIKQGAVAFETGVRRRRKRKTRPPGRGSTVGTCPEA